MMDAAAENSTIIINGNDLTLQSIIRVSRKSIKVAMTSEKNVQDTIIWSNKIANEVATRKKTVYGINTGFGGKRLKFV